MTGSGGSSLSRDIQSPQLFHGANKVLHVGLHWSRPISKGEPISAIYISNFIILVRAHDHR